MQRNSSAAAKVRPTRAVVTEASVGSSLFEAVEPELRVIDPRPEGAPPPVALLGDETDADDKPVVELEPYFDDPRFEGNWEHQRMMRSLGEGLTNDRPTTISIKRMPKRGRALLHVVYPEAEAVHATRPRSRGECETRDRSEPCPFVSCRHNLFASVSHNGNIKLEHGGREVWEQRGPGCSLDIADKGGITLEETAEWMNLTRERIRQLEDIGLAKLLTSLMQQGFTLEDLAPLMSRAAPDYDAECGE